MNCKTRKRSIVEKTEHDFGMGFLELMQTCKNDDIPIKEVAEMLGCTLSNLYRIFKKDQFCYFNHQKKLMLCDIKEFSADYINTTNIFSRSWNNKSQRVKVK